MFSGNLFLSAFTIDVPSVESDKFPPKEVIPLSLSELILTPESALQLPLSASVCNGTRLFVVDVKYLPVLFLLGKEAKDSWSDRQLPANWRLICSWKQSTKCINIYRLINVNEVKILTSSSSS